MQSMFNKLNNSIMLNLFFMFFLYFFSKYCFAQSIDMPINQGAASNRNSCVTSLTLGNGGGPITQFASVTSGGVLCPGVYIGQAYCDIRTSSPCGGTRCGWNITVSYAYGDAIAGRLSHTGCDNQGDICTNTTATIYSGIFTFYTDHAPWMGLSVVPWAEKGEGASCRIQVSKIQEY